MPAALAGAVFCLTVHAAPAAAQRRAVVLQVLPAPGDSFRIRLDQHVEMSGTSRVDGTDSTVTVASAAHILSRARVERREAGRRAATVIIAVTDSVSIVSSDGDVLSTNDEARRQMEGQEVRLRVTPDGATELLDDPSLIDRPELRAAFEPMPATLPGHPVAPGDSWTRTMALPQTGGGDGAHPTTIRATFRLDSLAGDLAYVSMHGAVSRDADAEGLPAGTKFVTTGVVSGTMIVDRKRAWVTDTRTQMTLKSTVTPPAGGGEPMRMSMKYTQWLRVER